MTLKLKTEIAELTEKLRISESRLAHYQNHYKRAKEHISLYYGALTETLEFKGHEKNILLSGQKQKKDLIVSKINALKDKK